MFVVPKSVSGAIEGSFGRGRVLVVGDLMVDAYLWGDVERISPEAPVPVVRVNRRSAAPGGSGNVLLNLVGLGMNAIAAGCVGDDVGGRQLCQLLADAGVSTSDVMMLANRPTTIKTRVVGGHHHMIRLDEETTEPLTGADTRGLVERVANRLATGVDAVILSDYAKGVLSDEVCQCVIAEARRRGVPVLVDPKGRSFAKYAGATALTPNLSEFITVTGVEHPNDPEFAHAGQRLREALQLDFLAVTCGDKGIQCFSPAGIVHHPAVAREVYDVSGAGDTVIATLTAALVARLCLDDALGLTNLAAGVVVGKLGTTPIHQGELLDAFRSAHLSGESSKVLDPATLGRRVADWRGRGERIVFTNGCFDLLHVGHVTLLLRARQEGDRLIVGLNTDRSVRDLKGKGRPVVTQDDRAQVLAGLSSVDAVVLFDEDTPLSLIERLRPDVLVKGGDYDELTVVGAEQVRSWNGRVAIIPLIEGRSTSKILANADGGADERAQPIP